MNSTFWSPNSLSEVEVCTQKGIKFVTYFILPSTAIVMYLINKYDPESRLYPKDLQKRAKIDQVLAIVQNLVQPVNAAFAVSGKLIYPCGIFRTISYEITVD